MAEEEKGAVENDSSLSDDDLDGASGGASVFANKDLAVERSGHALARPAIDVCKTPTPPGPVPIPYPNVVTTADDPPSKTKP